MSGRWDGRGREGVVLPLCLGSVLGDSAPQTPFFLSIPTCYGRVTRAGGFFFFLPYYIRGRLGLAAAGFPLVTPLCHFQHSSATTPRASPCTHAPFWGNPG